MTTITKTLLAGFHLGVGGNATGIGDHYYKKLAARRIPFVIMSADNFPDEAQSLARSQPDVPHFVGYRRSTAKGDAISGTPPSGDPNVPRYGIPAQQASDEHWAWHTHASVLPTEYDGSVTYLLTVNEPNKDSDAYVEWLADVEYYNCQKALAAGFRYAVFGWAGGNPEPRHWTGPNMTRLLNLIERNVGKLAVAVHEYSWVTSSIWNGRNGNDYSLVGRAHQDLLSKQPLLPLVITEFGWAERAAPTDVNQAVRETREVGELYARYRNYLGTAIWYLGPNYGEIHNIVNTYIRPLGDHIINNPIEVEEIADPVDPTDPPVPPPGETWERRAWDASVAEQIARGIPLNPKAALQAAILGAGMTPVHREINVEGVTIQAGESLTGNPARRVYAWQSGVPVRFFSDPSVSAPVHLLAPQLSQRDGRWANTVLGQNTGHSKTIGNWGCLLTAYTSMAQYMALATDNPAQMNGRMVAAGAFSAQYIQAGALRTAFPNGVTYHGFKTRDDATMVNTIKEYLSSGIPVPAQVDHNPATPQWEQHWVLIIGADGDDWIMMDPWYGDIRRVSDRYGIAGQDVLQALFYQPKTAVPSLPIPGEVVNVLPFLRGVDRVQFDLDYGSGTQTTQVRHLADDRWIYVKGEPGEYECLMMRNHNGAPWIFRAEDTSESPTRLYAHYLMQNGPIGAPWVPVEMEVGKWYTTTKFVQHYTKVFSNGRWQGACAPVNSGIVTDKIRLVSKPYNRTYASGKTLRVITLEWSSGEQYDFCEQFGNAAFRDATRNFWFMDGPLNGRQDKTFIKPALNVGW